MIFFKRILITDLIFLFTIWYIIPAVNDLNFLLLTHCIYPVVRVAKWYYDGNEIATKSDIPSTSDFLKTSGGTLSGNTTLTSGYGFLSSYSNNLKLLRVNSSSNYFLVNKVELLQCITILVIEIVLIQLQ